jgi:hypothetical protein
MRIRLVLFTKNVSPRNLAPIAIMTWVAPERSYGCSAIRPVGCQASTAEMLIRRWFGPLANPVLDFRDD